VKTRIIVGVTLLPLFLAVLLLCPLWATAGLVAAMSVLACYELLYTANTARDPVLLMATAVMAAAVSLNGYFAWSSTIFYALAFAYFAVLFLRMLQTNAALHFSCLTAAAFSAFVIPFALSGLTRILAMEHGHYLIFTTLILAFTSDTGAYFIGCRFGKHKLAPVISPKKSVEGLFGGVASCILFMLAYGAVLQFAFDFRVNYLYAALYGFIGSLASVVGDLLFSVIKRQQGIKDYGKLLPGHGGILDRFDSTVVTAPLAELLLTLLPFAVKGIV